MYEVLVVNRRFAGLKASRFILVGQERRFLFKIIVLPLHRH